MPPTHISHYALTNRLGEGTYGEVWKGVHVDDPSFVVAVKLVHPSVQGDPSFISALREECRALDRMDHPGIVRFRELVVRDGVVAMVLELLQGEDLEAALAAGPQPIAEVERVLERALEGLAYAHAAGVLHRDIKPGNLFRCRDGRVKLMDFGLARAIEGSNGTKTGTLKGTMDYMAPERFRGQTSAAADVYALGLVAWELLAGRRAAPAGDLPAKMGWHWSEGPPDVRTERADCPPWLASLVSELTSREVTARPADGSAALARLWALRGVSAPGTGPATSRPVVPGTVEVRLPTGLPASLPSRNIAGPGGGSVPSGSGPRAPGTVVAALPAAGFASAAAAAALSPRVTALPTAGVEATASGSASSSEAPSRSLGAHSTSTSDQPQPTAGPAMHAQGPYPVGARACVVDGFRKYRQFDGRSTRAAFWWFTAFTNFVTIVVPILIVYLAPYINFYIGLAMGYTEDAAGILSALWCLTTSVVCFLPSIACSTRRLHDIGKSGWWICVNFVPYVGPLLFLGMLVMGSEPRDNRYGPNPKAVPHA
jgi:serine/threonine protein kinase/uncharacterized membrane protein YhaH (DUF805 family)